MPRRASSYHRAHGPGLLDDVVTPNPCSTPIGPEQGGEDTHEDGLASPIGPKQGDDLTSVGTKVNAVEHEHWPEAL